MQQIHFENKTVSYRVTGTGKPLMLLHGFGEDGRVWGGLVPELAEKNKVVVPDLPGSGESQTLEGERSLEDYAKVIDTIAKKEFDDEPFTLIGHSMGGYITLAYAEKYPDRLASLGLFSSSPFADTEEKKEARRKSIDFIKKNDTEAFVKTSVPDLFSEQTKVEMPQLVDELLSYAKSVKADALTQYLQAMIHRPDRTAVLESFSRPVLLIFGKSDSLIPLDTSLKFSSMPAISFIHILKHSGHAGMLEERELSANYIKAFLATFQYTVA